VDHRKRRKIIHTAEYFLLRNPQLGNVACRFDVIAATGSAHQPDLTWIRNAF
jgi:putative endonuclease